MKTGKMTIASVLCAMAMLASMDVTAQSQDQVFNGSTYQCKIFTRWIKDSGLINLNVDGKTLIRSNRVHGNCKGTDNKVIALMEQTTAEYKWEDNILTNERFLRPRKAQGNDEGKYAKISRKITFEPDKVTVEITVTALQDITFPHVRRTLGEILGIVTDSVKGMRIEGILLDDQVISSVIPQKYDSKKWGFRKNIKQLKMTDSEKVNMVVTAAPNCKMLLNHYGGKQMNLTISPDLKSGELEQKAGSEIKLGYTIEFKKAE